MARPAKHKGWESSFGKFVAGIGAGEVAASLGVDPAAVYFWVTGKSTPRPSKAKALQELALRRGVRLSLDEIYNHSRDVRAPRFAKRKPQSARGAK
jgi:hypothetical protein